jgi:hypothetical protein
VPISALGLVEHRGGHMMTAIEAGHISVLGDGRGAGLTRALAPIGRTLRSPRIDPAPAASVDSAKGHRWGFGPAP